MPFAIEEKLVVAVASSALFDLAESDAVYRTCSLDEYRAFQREHEQSVLQPGVAFEFVRRLLTVGGPGDDSPVEVVLLSRNDPDTGLRVMRSIEHHGLPITRAAFLGGGAPRRYIDAFNAVLFLSANEDDVREALGHGCPAGCVMPSGRTNAAAAEIAPDHELRIAFDFDCVLADDEGERAYQEGGIDQFRLQETERRLSALSAGPLKALFERLARLQAHEQLRAAADPVYRRVIKTAIVTARNAPAHERVVTTLRSWGIMADETFFLGGMSKTRVLRVVRPHLFFDDQLGHLSAAAHEVPVVHVPVGPANPPARSHHADPEDPRGVRARNV